MIPLAPLAKKAVGAVVMETLSIVPAVSVFSRLQRNGKSVMAVVVETRMMLLLDLNPASKMTTTNQTTY